MRRWVWALALVFSSASAAGQAAGSAASPNGSKKAPEPFYRKYLVAGDPLDDKIVEQEHRVEASPQDPNLRNDFGNLLAARRFPEQAAEQYELSLELDKKNFIAAYNLGLLRETEGKVSAAIAAYKRSIKRKPGFPQSHFRLGRLYEHTNQSDAAVQEYAKAFWIDPAMREPKRNPLVIDSELTYRASLANYQRDVAVVSMGNEAVFFEESRFRKLPVDRAISSGDAGEGGEPEPAPRDVGGPNAAGGPAGEPGQARRPPRASAPAEGPGSVLGGRPRPTPGPRPNALRPSPVPPQGAAPALPREEPPATGELPESVPEPTPTPAPPAEVEPS